MKEGEMIRRPAPQGDGSAAYDAAARFLSFRPRSRKETEQYLRRKGFSPEGVDRALKKLSEERYLDDAVFAGFWVENRERFRPRSAFALRQELAALGVDRAVVEEALSGFDELRSARRALRFKIHLWDRLESPELKKKAFAFLRRRGFAVDVCLEAVEKERPRAASGGNARKSGFRAPI